MTNEKPTIPLKQAVDKLVKEIQHRAGRDARNLARRVKTVEDQRDKAKARCRELQSRLLKMQGELADARTKLRSER